MAQVPVWINPLDLLDAQDDEPTTETMMRAMCAPGVASDTQSVRARYQEITEVQPTLFAPPADDRILNQLIWPLRYAKASYVVGNYLGTISLAGIVAEMTAILMFDLLEPHVGDRPMGEAEQKQMFGRSFQELGHFPNGMASPAGHASLYQRDVVGNTRRVA